MPKFYVGQKVLVTGSTWFPIKQTTILVGKISEIAVVGKDVIAVYNEDKSRTWGFNQSDLQPINETPETLTINGVEYIRKPGPVVEHEWKFGDVATHEEYGVGIVTCIDDGEVEFHYKNGDYSTLLPSNELTFIRRADLSV